MADLVFDLVGTAGSIEMQMDRIGPRGVGIADVELNSDYTLTVTLTDGSSYTTESIRGEQGEPGQTGQTGAPGQPGEDGVSPTVSVTDITGGHRVTITDATGTESFDVMDGRNGADGHDGAPGADGVSPTVAVTPITDGHEVTITDKDGEHTFNVMNGEKGDPGTPGDPTTLIDDTTTTATNKTWSANKISGDLSQLSSALQEKYVKPQTGIPASDLAAGVIPSVPVQDVQVNGTSVLSQGVANVPVADATNPGTVKVNTAGNYDLGITINDGGIIYSSRATDAQIKSGSNGYKPIAPMTQHMSAFYGLAKAAGADMASVSGATVGTYPEAQKVAIQKMLGIYQAPWELIREDTFTNAEEADHEITVDGNGNAFELTDAILMFETPKQATAASKQAYGSIKFNDGTNDVATVYCNAWTQNANADAHGCWVIVENKQGMIFTYARNQSTTTNMGGLSEPYKEGFPSTSTDPLQGVRLINNFVIRKATILKVTGTGHYKLYGKRKWTT